MLIKYYLIGKLVAGFTYLRSKVQKIIYENCNRKWFYC